MYTAMHNICTCISRSGVSKGNDRLGTWFKAAVKQYKGTLLIFYLQGKYWTMVAQGGVRLSESGSANGNHFPRKLLQMVL